MSGADLSTLLADAVRDLSRCRVQLADAQAECAIYREMAQEAIHALAELTRQHNRQRQTNQKLRDELRRYTGRIAREVLPSREMCA